MTNYQEHYGRKGAQYNFKVISELQERNQTFFPKDWYLHPTFERKPFRNTSLNEVSSSLNFDAYGPTETKDNYHSSHGPRFRFERYQNNGIKSFTSPYDPGFRNYKGTSNIRISKANKTDKGKSHDLNTPSKNKQYGRCKNLSKKKHNSKITRQR